MKRKEETRGEDGSWPPVEALRVRSGSWRAVEDERLLIFGQALLDYAAAAALGNELTVRARCVAVG